MNAIMSKAEERRFLAQSTEPTADRVRLIIRDIDLPHYKFIVIASGEGAEVTAVATYQGTPFTSESYPISSTDSEMDILVKLFQAVMEVTESLIRDVVFVYKNSRPFTTIPAFKNKEIKS